MSLYEQWWQSWFGQNDFKPVEKEDVMLKCEECPTMVEEHQHYVNGGLCFKCIMNIGK